MQKYYYELKIEPNVHYALFLDILLELTSQAIEELNGTLILRSEEELSNIKEGIEKFTEELSIALKTNINCKIEYSKKENEDWISKYKNSITPVEAGQFYIHPSWCESKKNKINILIDPALTFGSGHHETTSSCLDMISKYTKENDTLLDVGCGSGILAIAGAKLNAVVDICDTDPLAVVDAKENFKNNNCTVNNSWEGSAVVSKTKYDVVIANIVTDVLIMIANDLKSSLKNNSILILSGILDTYKDKILTKFKKLKVIEIITKGEWVTIVLKDQGK